MDKYEEKDFSEFDELAPNEIWYLWKDDVPGFAGVLCRFWAKLCL